MPTPLTFDIFLDTTGPMAPCRLLTNADSSQPAVQPALVQADKLTVRLWLVVPATTIGAAATTLSHTGTIILALKADQSDTDLLALCSNFVSATVDGRTCYTGELNLNTAAMATAFSSPSVDTLNAWFDVELSNVSYRQTFQNRVTIYREVYNGTQPPPVDLPEWPIPATVMIKPSPAPAENMIAVFSNTSPGNVKDSGVDILEVCTRENDTLSNDDYLALFVNGLEAPGYDPEITSKDSTGARISANGLVRGDVDQTAKSEAWKAQARTNIGVESAKSGGVAAVSGEMTPSTAIPASDFAAYAQTDGAITGVLFRVVHGGGTYDVSGADSRFGTANLRGVEYVASTGVLTFYADGVAHATTQALTAGSVTVTKVLSAATGTLRSSAIFNRALTADERAAVMRGEVPAALAKAVISQTSSTFTEVNDNNSRLTITGTTFDKTAGTEATYSTCRAELSPKLPSLFAGAIVTVTLNVTLNSGNAADLPRVAYGDGNTYGDDRQLLPGVNTYTFNAFNGDVSGNHRLMLNWSATLGVTDGATNFTIAQPVVLQTLGTVARYEPENVTSLGRWLDSSGNGYDLIPGAGITPLRPQPVQTRTETLVFDGSASTVLRAARIAGFSIAKTSTGVYPLAMPSWIPAWPCVNVTAYRGIYGSGSTKPTAAYDSGGTQGVGGTVLVDDSAGTPRDVPVFISVSWPE